RHCAMQKKSTLWLMVTLSALLMLLAACGTNTATSNPAIRVATNVPPGENIYVLDGYIPQGAASYGQQIVAFHPASANPDSLVSLPTGLSSQDHERLYTTTTSNGQTTISVMDTRSGLRVRKFSIAGTYSSGDTSYDSAVISASGQWLALRDLRQSAKETTIALVDTQAGKLTKIIHLGANYTLDAISPGGKALYLLQKLNDAPGHYFVRVYNVDVNNLEDTPIVDKTANNPIGDPNMTGVGLARQVAKGGAFAYTLYIDTRRNYAFIHELPLNDQVYPPIAHCIDLPVGKSADLLHFYTLALSADGGTLYAANGALGVVSSVSVTNGDPLGIFNDKVRNTSHFNPGNASISNSERGRMLYNGATLTSDQKTLYFAGIQGIWAVNTSDLSMQSHYLAKQALTGVALSSDNQTLYAVDPASGITLLSATTGQTQRVIQGPAHTPWGIEWVAN
ncbi:MAG TPA: hypothetical protein VIY29_10765, partial [Ktedonobacteraceae bacterium]